MDIHGYGNVSSASYNLTTNGTFLINGTSLRRSAGEEFWQYNVLQMSGGFGEFGTVPWHLAVSLLVAWVIVFLCIMKGIEVIGKIVYVTVLLPYVLLTVLLIRGLTLEGAMDGLEFYLKPDLKKMLTLQVWIEAGLQVFISVGAAWGPVITMASFNKFRNNCLRDSMVICLVGEGTSVFCGFIVFTILGFLAKELNVPIADVVSSGPGLGFVAYPEALTRLPLPQIWSVIFFLALFFVGLDTQFATVETVITIIIDIIPRFRKRRTLLTLLICALGYLLGLPMCSKGGMYIFQLLDWYATILAIPLFGLIECLVIGWIYGAERFSHDIELMLGRGVPVFMRVCWCVITPFTLVGFFIFSLMTYLPPKYGTYSYPVGAQVFGWLVAVIPVLALVLPAVHTLVSYKGGSFITKLSKSVQPTKEWIPHDAECRKIYQAKKYTYQKTSLLARIKCNIIGQ